MPVLHTDAGLVRAAIAISAHELRAHHPELVEGVLDQYADEIRARAPGLAGSKPAPRRNEALLAHVHQLLFEEAGFQGDRNTYNSTRNSYLPEVVRTRKGIPISLCLVYKAVCSRLGIAVAGVNAPYHFLVRVDTGPRPILIDPFDAGRLVDPQEAIEAILSVVPDVVPVDMPDDVPEQASHEQTEPEQADAGSSVRDLLPPATHAQWIARMLANLTLRFENQGRPDDVAAMLELGAVLAHHHGRADTTGDDA